MISPKKIIKMAKTWQKFASIDRRRISLPRNNRDLSTYNCSTSSSVAHKGHFVIYTTDQKRFVIPLVYLSNNIFRELFKMSEEEFGLPRDGPIILPCDAVFMKHIVSIIQRGGVAKDLEKAMLISMATTRCSLYTFHQAKTRQQELLVCGH